jgi:hypothetical protein
LRGVEELACGAGESAGALDMASSMVSVWDAVCDGGGGGGG